MKVDRLVSIIMVLLDKKRISAQELADMFEVSSRTIYRDMESINMAGIPVHSISGVGGGFEVMDNYKVDRKVFSTGDLSALLMGLSSLSGMVRGDELVGALAKVKSFIPADKARDIELKVNQIHVDLDPWMGNRNIKPNLEIIKTALEESRPLSYEYIDNHGNKTTRTAEPYQLVLKNSNWYLHGFCRTRNDFRLFKLSRMSRLRILDEVFTPQDHQKPVLEFVDTLETLQTRITIRIHRLVVERVLDFCAYEDLVQEDEDHYIVSFPFMENDYYYGILLGLGDKCECLEPSHFRKEMKRRIDNLAALYENWLVPG